MKAINKINRLYKQYFLFSPEANFIGEVRFWIKKATESLIPVSYLELAESCVNVYETKVRCENERCIVKTLREIIQDAYNNLSPKNHMRRI